METLYYRMKWGWDVALITLLTLVLIFGISIAGFVSGGDGTKGGMVLLLIVVPVLLCTLLYMPYGMGCSDDGVYVRRVKGTLWIPYDEIQSLSPIDPSDVLQFRVMGSGGFMGYFGLFRSRKLGNFVLYATQRKGMVLIETSRKKYVVNCPDPVAFVECCNRYRRPPKN